VSYELIKYIKTQYNDLWDHMKAALISS